MCGLAGFTGKKPVNIDKMRLLVLANKERGSDSTGIYGTQRFRQVAPADQFITEQGFETAIKNAKHVVAHTRKKSSGAVNKESAHPFRIGIGEDSLVGAHNGTLWLHNLKKACEKFELEEPEVDSELIFQALHKFKSETGVLDFKVLTEIDGHMALAFVYKGLLHLYRRDSRPLHYAQTPEGIYFSSEPRPLYMIGAKTAVELPKDKMHIFKDGELINVEHVKEYKYEYKPPQHNTSRNWEHGGGYNPHGPKGGGSPRQSILPAKTETNTTSKADDWERITSDVLLNYPSIKLDIDETVSMDYEDHFSCLLFVRLVDTIHTQPISGWYVGLKNIDGDHSLTETAVSTGEGFAALKLDKSFFNNVDKTTKQFVIYNPIDGAEYYSADIELITGRVLEVTLSIPFRKEETKNTEDGNRVEPDAGVDGSKGGTKGKTFEPETKRTDMSPGNASDFSQDRRVREVESKLLWKNDSKEKGKDSKQSKIADKFRNEDEYLFYIEEWYGVSISELLKSDSVQKKIWEEDGWVSEERWREEMSNPATTPCSEKREFLLKSLSSFYPPTRFDLDLILDEAVHMAQTMDQRVPKNKGRSTPFMTAVTYAITNQERKFLVENELPFDYDSVTEYDEDEEGDSIYSEAYEIQKDPVMTMIAGTSNTADETRVTNLDDFEHDIKTNKFLLNKVLGKLKSADSKQCVNEVISWLNELEHSTVKFHERIKETNLIQ